MPKRANTYVIKVIGYRKGEDLIPGTYIVGAGNEKEALKIVRNQIGDKRYKVNIDKEQTRSRSNIPMDMRQVIKIEDQ